MTNADPLLPSRIIGAVLSGEANGDPPEKLRRTVAAMLQTPTDRSPRRRGDETGYLAGLDRIASGDVEFDQDAAIATALGAVAEETRELRSTLRELVELGTELLDRQQTERTK